MPVSLVKPSSTACGTYSDHAKRLSSSAAAACGSGAAVKSRAASPASARTVERIMDTSLGVSAPQRLGEHDGADGHEDEHGRDRVERRIEALLHAAEDLERERARSGARGEVGDDQLVERQREGHQ